MRRQPAHGTKRTIFEKLTDGQVRLDDEGFRVLRGEADLTQRRFQGALLREVSLPWSYLAQCLLHLRFGNRLRQTLAPGRAVRVGGSRPTRYCEPARRLQDAPGFREG